MDEMVDPRSTEVHESRDLTHRRLQHLEKQLTRVRRVEAAHRRQRERLLLLFAKSMAELGISVAEVRDACRDYRLREKDGRF